jgi:Calcineurin-like phosphoesterase superfamily domain
VDIDDWAVAYPETEVVRLAGKAIYVLHDLKTLQINPIARGIDVVVSGHSHVPKIDTADGVLYLNPGSAGRRRFGLPITLATIDVTSGNLRPGNPRSRRRMNPPRGCVSSKRWQVQMGRRRKDRPDPVPGRDLASLRYHRHDAGLEAWPRRFALQAILQSGPEAIDEDAGRAEARRARYRCRMNGP